MNGKSISIENPDGVRRVVNGKTLAPRSKRRTEKELISYQAWCPIGPGRNAGHMVVKTIEVKKSLVFID